MRRELRSEDQGGASDVGGWSSGSNGDGTQAPGAGIGSGRPDELTCQDTLHNAVLPARMESTWSPVHEVGNGAHMCSSKELGRAHARWGSLAPHLLMWGEGAPESVNCLSDVYLCLPCPRSSMFVFAQQLLTSPPPILCFSIPAQAFGSAGAPQTRVEINSGEQGSRTRVLALRSRSC